MRWEGNTALSNNAGKVLARVTENLFGRSDYVYAYLGDGDYVGAGDKAALRRKVEAALLRRHFRHEWRGVALVVNGETVGKYVPLLGALLPLCIVHDKPVRRDTPNGCKAAAVAIAKREFLSRL